MLKAMPREAAGKQLIPCSQSGQDFVLAAPEESPCSAGCIPTTRWPNERSKSTYFVRPAAKRGPDLLVLMQH